MTEPWSLRLNTEAEVTVVIPHFYAEREPNLSAIAEAFLSGTVRPREILVWCNEPLHGPPPKGISVIVSHRNVGSQARFLAALAAQGEKVLFLDNDVCPQPRTVEALLYWQERLGEIVTLEGRIKNPGSYRSWRKLYGSSVTEPVEVQISLGRGEMLPRVMLPRLLQHFPFRSDTVMDDLWLSAAAAREGIRMRVVPASKDDASLKELPQYGVGLCLRPEFYAERDAALAAIAGL